MEHMRRIIEMRRKALLEAEQTQKDLEASKAAGAEKSAPAPASDTKTESAPAAPSGATPPPATK